MELICPQVAVHRYILKNEMVFPEAVGTLNRSPAQGEPSVSWASEKTKSASRHGHVQPLNLTHFFTCINKAHYDCQKNKTHRILEAAFSTPFHCTLQVQFSTFIWKIWHPVSPSVFQALGCLKELMHTRVEIFF